MNELSGVGAKMNEASKEISCVLIQIPYERFIALENAVTALTAGIESLLDKNQTINIAGIAARQGVSVSKAKQEVWRQPNFGNHEGRKHQWMRSVYLECEKNLEERRLEWERMSISQQLLCRGIENPARTGTRRRKAVMA